MHLMYYHRQYTKLKLLIIVIKVLSDVPRIKRLIDNTHKKEVGHTYVYDACSQDFPYTTYRMAQKFYMELNYILWLLAEP